MRIKMNDFLKVRIMSSGTTGPTCPLAVTRPEGQEATPWRDGASGLTVLSLAVSLIYLSI